jgi:23S rRNA (uracil1939-C5)-methyltransferase
MMSSETPATCPHCAAGPYAGVTYEDELTAKAGLLRRELGGSPRLAAAFDLERVGLRPSPVREGYRGSVKLVFGWDKAAKEAVLGIYEPGSHRLVDLAACREHDPRLDPLLEAVRRGVKERGLPVYREEGGKGFLRYLQARVLPDGRQLACFVTPHAEGGWQETLEEWARELRAQLPQLFSVCQNLNPGRGNAVLGPVTTLLEGQFTVPCRFLETPVAVSATSFQQANLPVFRAILAELRGWVDGLGAEARVADLYCGCGAIGLSVTRRQPLFLLEADHASQIPLMEAARADGREEINVTRGRVEDCLTSLELFEPDLVIVDPPRKGLDPALREALAQLRPRALAYLSCNPFTQARDLELLLSDPAWRLDRLTGYDMLPGTERLECLALLTRRP